MVASPAGILASVKPNSFGKLTVNVRSSCSGSPVSRSIGLFPPFPTQSSVAHALAAFQMKTG